MVISEVRVDRWNEKWVFVAEQILNILHASIPEQPHPSWMFWKKPAEGPVYTFEIASIKGVIRFFVSAPENYIGIFENQIYAHFPNVEIERVEEYLSDTASQVVEMKLDKSYLFPIKTYTQLKDKSEKETIDPLSSLTSSLAKCRKQDIAVTQFCFTPITDDAWKSEKLIKIHTSHDPYWKKKLKMIPFSFVLFLLLKPFQWLFQFMKFVAQGSSDHAHDEHHDESDEEKMMYEKTALFGYSTTLRLASLSSDPMLSKVMLREMVTAMSIFGRPDSNKLVPNKNPGVIGDMLARKNSGGIILNTAEVAGIFHMPTIYVQTPGINWVTTKKFQPPADLPILDGDQVANPSTHQITPIGVTNFRGTDISFGMLPDDRRRHVYVIGKTGMGKSTLLENMIFDDISKGRWVGIVDPHGDLAETILASIPKNRTNDVILFDPSDAKFPIAFNMLEQVTPDLRPIVASGLVGVFKKIFGDSWGPRLEHILRNTVMTLLEIPDATIMSIPLMLTMKSYRQRIVSKVQDPILKKFWEAEFEAMGSSSQTEAAGPILNKVGQFLSSPLVRNIVGQPKNPFSLRWAMDNKKIVIVNLSKGKIGEDSSALLGSMMITKFQIDAMSRADIAEKDRVDFYLYVDEFQNFATDSFATILSEARKYRLNLVMANQFVDQMNENVRGAVFGNVGTIASFQVGIHDAKVLAEVMDEETVLPNDLMNLRKYDIYTKLLIGGMPSPVFSATTFAPIHARLEIPEQKRDIVAKVSREKYAKPVSLVEKKILEFNIKVVEDEKKFKIAEEAYKEKKKEEKRLKTAGGGNGSGENTGWPVDGVPSWVITTGNTGGSNFDKKTHKK
jgi:hypothetical protein